jgi:hypothetical protein
LDAAAANWQGRNPRASCRCPVPSQEARRAFDEERRANDALTSDADRDRQAIEDLKSRCDPQRGGWALPAAAARMQASVRAARDSPPLTGPTALRTRTCSLAHATEDLSARDEAAAALREGLELLRDDYAELQGQHAAAQRDGGSREKQREMEVRRAGGCWTGSGQHAVGHAAAGTGPRNGHPASDRSRPAPRPAARRTRSSSTTGRSSASRATTARSRRPTASCASAWRPCGRRTCRCGGRGGRG